MLELHRFPSLNSTGRIRAELSIDGGERILVESRSNDEWRGTWKLNILNNVDKLTVELPRLTEGEHILHVYAVDRYFAFSRIVIYTEDIKESMFGGSACGMKAESDEKLPCEGQGINVTSDKVRDALYAGVKLKPRAMLVAGVTPGSNTLPDTNSVIEWNYSMEYPSYTITAQKLISMADTPFYERNGTIRIDMGAVLADNRNAYADGVWDYCLSESYNRTGIAMYIRRPGETYEADKPSLHYRIACDGGIYTLWLLMKNESYDGAELLADIDGVMLPREQLAGGERIGNYCGERVYRWIRLWRQEIPEGEHEIGIYTSSSDNRFDRIYMTKGEEMPPCDDKWKKEE